MRFEGWCFPASSRVLTTSMCNFVLFCLKVSRQYWIFESCTLGPLDYLQGAWFKVVKNVVDLIWCADKSLCFWHFPMSMQSSLPHSLGPWKNCKPFQGKKMQGLRFLGVVFGFPKVCRGQICNPVAHFTLGCTTWLLVALVVSTHFTTMFANWEIFLERDLNFQHKSLNVQSTSPPMKKNATADFL